MKNKNKFEFWIGLIFLIISILLIVAGYLIKELALILGGIIIFIYGYITTKKDNNNKK